MKMKIKSIVDGSRHRRGHRRWMLGKLRRKKMMRVRRKRR